MTIRRLTIAVAAISIATISGVQVAHADKEPSATQATPTSSVVHSTTVSATKQTCVRLGKSHPGLIRDIRFYHGRYIHWRSAMGKGSHYGAFHRGRRVAHSCSVEYGRWTRATWKYRAHRAYRHYKRWHKAHAWQNGSPVDIGRYLAAQRGWVGSQFQALYLLWNRESGWNPNAYNASSGACGIPQALPCSKIPDHSVIGQITWGLGYISGRYGSPAAAWAHSESYGWY